VDRMGGVEISKSTDKLTSNVDKIEIPKFYVRYYREMSYEMTR
jgi:hypothetical protein